MKDALKMGEGGGGVRRYRKSHSGGGSFFLNFPEVKCKLYFYDLFTSIKCWEKILEVGTFKNILNNIQSRLQTINLFANELWSKFFRHGEISSHPTFLAFRNTWIQTALKKTVK